MPDPTTTPVPSFSKSSFESPESKIASEAAKKEYADVSLMNLSILRSILVISTSTVPDTWHLMPFSLYSSLNLNPDFEFFKESKTCSFVFPRGDKIPIPVITTFFML